MSIIVTAVVPSGKDVELTICSYQCPRIKLGSALILIVTLFLILPAACVMLKTGASILPEEFCFDRRFGIFIWGNSSIGCFRVVEDEM